MSDAVRIKLSYGGRTFRRTVEPGAFAWESFLQWGLECFPGLADPRAVTLTYEDEDGDRPTIARAEDFREALDTYARLNRPLRILMEDSGSATTANAPATPPAPAVAAMAAALAAAAAQEEQDEEDEETETVIVDPVFPRAQSQRTGATGGSHNLNNLGSSAASVASTVLGDGGGASAAALLPRAASSGAGMGDSQSTHPLSGTPTRPPPARPSDADANADAPATAPSAASSSAGPTGGAAQPSLGAIPTITAEVLAAIQESLRGNAGDGASGGGLPGVHPRVGEAVRQIAQEHVLPGVVALLNQPDVRQGVNAVVRDSLGLASAFLGGIQQNNNTGAGSSGGRPPAHGGSTGTGGGGGPTTLPRGAARRAASSSSSSAAASAPPTAAPSAPAAVQEGAGAGSGSDEGSNEEGPAPSAPPATAPTATTTEEEGKAAEAAEEGSSDGVPAWRRGGAVVHHGVRCDKCHRSNFEGLRFKDAVRRDYDLCEACAAAEHPRWPFPLLMIRDPAQAPAAILTVLPPERDISYEHDATRTHVNVQCDGCGVTPIVGDRYACGRRRDYDLCEQCVQRDATGFPLLQIARPSQAPAFFHVTPKHGSEGAEGAEGEGQGTQQEQQQQGQGAGVGAHYYHPRHQRACWRRNAARSRREERAQQRAAGAATAGAVNAAVARGHGSHGHSHGHRPCGSGAPIIGQIARAFLEGAGLRCGAAGGTGVASATNGGAAAAGPVEAHPLYAPDGQEQEQEREGAAMASSFQADLLRSAEGLTEEELLEHALALSAGRAPTPDPQEDELLARALSLSAADAAAAAPAAPIPVAQPVAHANEALPLAPSARAHTPAPAPAQAPAEGGEQEAEAETTGGGGGGGGGGSSSNDNDSDSAAVAPAPRAPYAARFVADVTYPDGTRVAPGVAFRKTWRLANTGRLPFPADTRLAFAYGHLLGGPLDSSVHVGPVPPGEEFSVTVPLVAPGEASQYIGCWQLEGTDPEKGERLTLGNRIWVDIQVVDGSEGDAEGGFGGGSEWEVVTAPTEEEEGQEEESAAAAAEGAVSTPSDGASVVVVGEQAAAEAASVEGEGEEDETWKRWEKELACLSEMGFETRLDACVAALERVRPTDAAGLQSVVEELLRLSLTEEEGAGGGGGGGNAGGDNGSGSV